jgi:hypothetical protein
VKSFIYTFHEKRKQPACVYTVRIYQIVRGVPVFKGELSDTYVSEFQIVLLCMQAFKMVPKKAFETNPNTGGMKLSYASDAKYAGFFQITRVS